MLRSLVAQLLGLPPWWQSCCTIAMPATMCAPCRPTPFQLISAAANLSFSALMEANQATSICESIAQWLDEQVHGLLHHIIRDQLEQSENCEPNFSPARVFTCPNREGSLSWARNIQVLIIGMPGVDADYLLHHRALPEITICELLALEDPFAKYQDVQ